MDWFPLYNSVRIAGIATVITFFAGILCAYYIAKLPNILKGIVDCILTLPLVMPPTVIGFFILKTIGINGACRKIYIQYCRRENNDDMVCFGNCGCYSYFSAYVQDGKKFV